MKLNIKKSGRFTYLYAAKSFRTHNGKSTTKVMEKFGTVEKLRETLNGEDPIEWAQKRVDEMTALEKEECSEISIKLKPTVSLKEGEQHIYNGGYLFLQKIYHELGLHTICKKIGKKHKFDFDLNSILSRLIYSRIMFPASKAATNELSKKFIEHPNFELHQIYRALSILSEESDSIQALLYKNSLKSIERKTGVIYYDCTNFFFETEEADGIKQYGVSKEHRPSPIVQMGLFMDADGLPLAFDINPGNTNEQTTLQPLEKKLSQNFNLSQIVVCTDAGLSSLDNRKYNNVGGRAFITTQSIKKLKGHLKDWALNPDGWRVAGGNKEYNINQLDPDIDYSEITFYKERWMNENGLEQRIIVSYSIKYRNFTSRKRKHQIERAERAIKSSPAKVNSKRATDYKRFIEQTQCTPDGEVATLSSFDINEGRIEEEAKYDGFYAVCTNLEDDIYKILKINQCRWEIEESFRIMKSEFKARPVYLQRDDRIKAHFLVCFISLFVFRVLEKKTLNKYTPEKLIDTLVEMNFYDVRGEGYIPTYTRTETVDELHRWADFRTDYEIISKQKIKKIISATKR